MSRSPKRAAKRRPSFLVRLVKVLYLMVFILSLVIVVGFAAVNIFAPKPTVDGQVTIPPRQEAPSVPPAATDGLEASDAPSPTPDLVLHRRDDVFTCLLLGVADQGGTDTIMLGVFDTKAKKASLSSIPRDTVVYYNGRYQKINATYAGGEKAVAEAVRDLLGVPVDYWVSVNLKAFSTIVDQIGGVYFDVPVRMDYKDPYQDLVIDIQPGYQLLDGKKAVGVMRCRNCYINADIGRAATQRAFLTALVKQTVTLSNATKVTELINILNTYVDSDMPLNNMVFFGTQAVGMDLDTDLASCTLEGTWISPFIYLDQNAVLELVNGLGIYEEELPIEVLNLVRR